MTTVPMTSNDCPTEELLAAFIDDRLDPATRRKVMEHIADCGDCRDLVLMAHDLQQEEMANTNVTEGNFGTRRWIVAATGVAAAAVIAVFVLQPSPLFTPHTDDVLEAAQSFEKRPIKARLEGMEYKAYNEPKRGPGDEENDTPWQLLAVQEKLERAWSPDRRAEGVSRLLQSENANDLTEAVDALTAALMKAPKSERDSISIDLSAALIARAAWTGDDEQRDLIQALLLSEDVWRRKSTPEAAWNRALALAAMGRDDQAIRAWDDYLKLDSTSKWADEARQNKTTIVELSKY